jgi:hypothetical protein
MNIDLINFRRREALVHHDRPGIELGAGKHESAERHRVFARQQHPVSRPDLQSREVCRNRLDRVRERSISPDPAGFDESRMFRLLGNVGNDNFVYAIGKSGQDVGRGCSVG